jgi:hypothetical protein
MFSHPNLVIYCFATPPITLKLGQQIGGRLLNGNQLDQSLYRANQKLWSSVRPYSLRSFLQVLSIAAFSPATAICAITLNQNYFPEPNRHILTFLHPILLCRIRYCLWRCTIAIVLGWLPRFYSPPLILLWARPFKVETFWCTQKHRKVWNPFKEQSHYVTSHLLLWLLLFLWGFVQVRNERLQILLLLQDQCIQEQATGPCKWWPPQSSNICFMQPNWKTKGVVTQDCKKIFGYVV